MRPNLVINPDQLYLRRLAARALDVMYVSSAIEGVVLRFDPDDPTQVFPGSEPGEFIFSPDFRGRNPRTVAHVFLLDGTLARVLVPNIEDVIRPNHLREFNARELGFHRQPGVPDVDVEVDLVEVISEEGELLRTRPQRVPMHVRQPSFKVFRAYNGE
ncbi:MAG: hypothetical protein RJA59_1270 [Pseudomonadota bacterium]|jgi:hypothetical protein